MYILTQAQGKSTHKTNEKSRKMGHVSGISFDIVIEKRNMQKRPWMRLVLLMMAAAAALQIDVSFFYYIASSVQGSITTLFSTDILLRRLCQPIFFRYIRYQNPFDRAR